MANGLRSVFADFDKRFTSAPYRVELGIAGVAFDCRSWDEKYIQSVAGSVNHASGNEKTTRPILIDSQGPSGFGMWPQWAEQYFNEREVESKLSDCRYRLHYFDELDFWQFYERDTGRGIQLMPGPGEYPPWDPGSPLRNLLHWASLESGTGLLHAGTLALKETGLLLAGSGGSGKSGTVAAGILHGLGTVGDDYVAVSTGDDVRAFAVFTKFKQDPKGIRRLWPNEPLPTASSLNWQGKHLINICDISQHPHLSKIDIRAICLPRVSHAATTTFRPAGSREAFLALAPSGVTQIPSARAEMFALCARLARQLPAWHVDLGTEPAEIAAAFKKFMERIRS